MSEAETIIAGDRRAAARLMTRAEAGDPTITPVLRQLYLAGGNARVIGITGPPGVGKSTLVDHLVHCIRERGQTVAVLAVDPTSPFSGGAVLGDRVRMARHAEDPGVFIRSMAARGALGGLALAAGDALTVFDAMGFNVLIVETVGVGQSEIDIRNHAQIVVLLQTALSGDVLQTVKAGILEAADIVVINKANVSGSQKMAQILAHTLAERVSAPDAWRVPVLLTEAADGSGIQDVLRELGRFAEYAASHPHAEQRRLHSRLRARVATIIDARSRSTAAYAKEGAAMRDAVAEVAQRISDPHTLAIRLLGGRAPSSEELSVQSIIAVSVGTQRPR